MSSCLSLTKYKRCFKRVLLKLTKNFQTAKLYLTPLQFLRSKIQFYLKKKDEKRIRVLCINLNNKNINIFKNVSYKLNDKTYFMKIKITQFYFFLQIIMVLKLLFDIYFFYYHNHY